MIDVIYSVGTKILNVVYTGEVKLEDVIDYIEATEKNAIYPRVLKILSVATNAFFVFEPEDLQAIVDANNKSLKNYNQIIDAIVIASPNETALSILYKELALNPNYKFKIFSSRDSARYWLLNQE
ncbi:MAG: hypothetical protein PF541_07595 [Prolixibacteraceae bacterium]|jgi:hypothetical protein|nr:hypothetical protein [Prolixibacteraceae bacterium]